MTQDTLIPASEASSTRSAPLCVMFADLAGSTALFESMGNTQAARLVTECTELMGAATRQLGGHVVKVLGDGTLCVFATPEMALSAARELRQRVATLKLDVNVGVEFGDVVQREGDVFGDAVNMAARLSDVAQRGEILVGEGAFRQLSAEWREACRSLSRIVLKGKSTAMPVWRLEPREEMQTGPHLAYTQIANFDQSASFMRTGTIPVLVLTTPNGTVHRLIGKSKEPLVLGRTKESQVSIDDPRVSRSHATLSWHVDHFNLTDHSSNGTWLRFGGNTLVHTLRRSSMALLGAGEISLGASLLDGPQVTLRFELIAQG